MIKFLIGVRDGLPEKLGEMELVRGALFKATWSLGIGGATHEESLRGAGVPLRTKSPLASFYEIIRPHIPPCPWACVVWSSTTTPKHSFVLWLAMLGRLRTMDSLGYLETDPTCVLCRDYLEDHGHLFGPMFRPCFLD